MILLLCEKERGSTRVRVGTGVMDRIERRGGKG